MRDSIKSIISIIYIIGLTTVGANTAFADCTNPAAISGTIEYFPSAGETVHRYCDGTNWTSWAGRTFESIPAPQYTSAGGVTFLPQLQDVDDSMTPSSGEVLLYSGGQWIAGSVSGGGGGGLWSQGAAQDIYYDSAGTPMVGIGTTDPIATLHVVGDIVFTGNATDISDIRLKENIQPIKSSLDQIMRLEAISFTMKDDPLRRVEYGFSAQQMLEIYPALVRTADDADHTLSLNYLGMVALLTRSMQEQQAQILEQKAEIAELKRAQRELLTNQGVARFHPAVGYRLDDASGPTCAEMVLNLVRIFQEGQTRVTALQEKMEQLETEYAQMETQCDQMAVELLGNQKK